MRGLGYPRSARRGQPRVSAPREVVVTTSPDAPRSSAHRGPELSSSFANAFDAVNCLPGLREWVRTHVPDDDLAIDAELVVTELISNAVDHGAPPYSVRMNSDGGEQLHIEVTDAGSGRDLTVGSSRLGSDRGRGLLLVNAVSHWGVRRFASSKTVWASLSSPPGEAPRPARSTASPRPVPHVVPDESPLTTRVHVLHSGQVVLVELAGELDVPDTAHLENLLRSATVAHPAHLVMDVTGLTFLSSGGFGALINANFGRHDIHGAPHLTGVAANRRVARLITISGLDPYLDIAPDRDQLLLELGCAAEEFPPPTAPAPGTAPAARDTV